MLKGKNLWILLGVGAVAYYYWMQKKKKDTTSAPSVAFTGDLGVPEYQNAYGVRRAPYTGQNFDFSQGNYITNPYKNTYRGR
jgi:hypothetical protein